MSTQKNVVVKRSIKYACEECESSTAYVFQVPDVKYFQDPVSCYLFYCLLDLSCGECNVISLYFLCCSVNGPVCLLAWSSG